MAGRRQTFLLRAKSWQVTCSGTVTLLASAWRSVPRSVALRARRPRAMSVDDRLQRSETAVPLDDVIAEAQRAFSICNACRYCEGYCAVFPALERRLSFTQGDAHYLANLCHNCGACLYACQYAPPHEFQLNLVRVLAQVRNETYNTCAWPRLLASAFARNGVFVSWVTALSIVLTLMFAAWFANPAPFMMAFSDAEQSFYAIVPHSIMAGVFGA